MYPFYLGIDLNLKRTYLVLMSDSGEVIDERRVSNNEINQYLKKNVSHSTYAVIEAICTWAFMYYQLVHEVVRVKITHLKEVVAICSAVVKADRIDAKVLVNFARLNTCQLPMRPQRRNKI